MALPVLPQHRQPYPNFMTTQEKWTPAELQAEWIYRKAERLAILNDGGSVGQDAIDLATKEANEIVEKLRRG